MRAEAPGGGLTASSEGPQLRVGPCSRISAPPTSRDRGTSRDRRAAPRRAGASLEAPGSPSLPGPMSAAAGPGWGERCVGRRAEGRRASPEESDGDHGCREVQ